MSTRTQTPSESFFRRYLDSPRAQRRALWAGLGIFAVGAAALVFVFFRNTAEVLPDKASNQPAQVAKPEPKVPVSPEIVAVMKKFISTAVLRKNLDEAYAITGPDLRGGLTRKQFESGAIAVVPYPAANIQNVEYRVDWSHPTEASLEVVLNPSAGHPGTKRQAFFIGFKKINGHWVVNYWSPRYRPPVPVLQ